MYDRILFPTDGSDAAADALAVAVAVADAHDAELHLLYVADTNQPSLARIEAEVTDVLVREGEQVVEAAEQRARSAGVDATTAVIQGGPSRTILDYVDDRAVDLVVMGTRGERGARDLLLGSVTERVVRGSPVPVLAVPAESEETYPPSEVLVGTDGSPGSEAAIDEAIDVAAGAGATLHAVSVVESTLFGVDLSAGFGEEEREYRDETALAGARDRAADAGVDVETAIEDGTVVETLVEYAAAHGADLIVVGTHGRAGIDGRLLGSVTEDLLRRADVPVLCVRADATD